MSRTRYFQCICQNPECENHESMGLHKLLGSDGAEWVGTCDKCGTENRKKAPDAIAPKKRMWPHYNHSTGTVFESESHEKAMVKANNWEAV